MAIAVKDVNLGQLKIKNLKELCVFFFNLQSHYNNDKFVLKSHRSHHVHFVTC